MALGLLFINFTLIPCEKILNLSKEARRLAIFILKLFFANSNSIIKLYQLKLFVREGAVPGSNSQNLLYSIFFGHENENVHEKHNFSGAPCTCIYSEVVGPG